MFKSERIQAKTTKWTGCGSTVATAQTNPDLERIAEAADSASTEEEKKKLRSNLADTEGLTESGGIAQDVLEKLLPDDELVVLPRVEKIGGSLFYRIVKRLFDVLSCSCALILLAVPMAIIALKIKAESPGPAIYAQRRCGKDGRIFNIYKFRSMYIDAEIRGAQWASEDDPRVTPFGKILRQKRLDELPQFWNVIKNDMSLIGPRPERPVFHQEFCKRIDGWDQRLLVKPGISGLAQVNGGYELLPKDKAFYDIEYIENRSIAMDWNLIWKTLKTLFDGEGAR